MPRRIELAGAIAGGLVACATPWALASFSGMEVTLAGFTLVAAVREIARGRWRAAGLWLAAAFLARPESLAVAVVAAGVASRAGKRA